MKIIHVKRVCSIYEGVNIFHDEAMRYSRDDYRTWSRYKHLRAGPRITHAQYRAERSFLNK